MTALAIAHRAGNSVDSLRAAVEAGVDVVEADVHAYRGRLEVRHNKTLGPLPFLWDQWELVSTSVPRLELAALLQAAQPGTVFMLDVKGTSASVGAAVARALHEIAPGHDVIVCSRFWPAVDAAAVLPYVRPVLSARNGRELARLRTRLATSEAYGVSLHRSLLTPALVAELRQEVLRS